MHQFQQQYQQQPQYQLQYVGGAVRGGSPPSPVAPAAAAGFFVPPSRQHQQRCPSTGQQPRDYLMMQLATDGGYDGGCSLPPCSAPQPRGNGASSSGGSSRRSLASVPTAADPAATVEAAPVAVSDGLPLPQALPSMPSEQLEQEAACAAADPSVSAAEVGAVDELAAASPSYTDGVPLPLMVFTGRSQQAQQQQHSQRELADLYVAQRSDALAPAGASMAAGGGGYAGCGQPKALPVVVEAAGLQSPVMETEASLSRSVSDASNRADAPPSP